MLTRLLRERLRPHARMLLGIVALQLVASTATLLLPSLNADVIDVGVARGDTGYILRTGAVMVVIALVQVAAAVLAVRLAASMAMAVGRDLRADVFAAVGAFSSREVARFGAPSLITRSTNDVQQVQGLVVAGATMLVTAPLTCIGGIVLAVRTDAGLSWLVVVAVPVLAGAIGLIIRAMVPQFRAMQGRLDTVNRVLREQITGIRVVRAFVREPVEVERFGRANTDLATTQLRATRLMALIQPTVLLILNVSCVAVLWFGAARVDRGEMGVGALSAFLTYLVQILTAVLMVSFISIMIPRAAVCAERITEVLDTPSSVVTSAAPVAVPTGAEAGGASLQVRDVTVEHPGASAPVLSGVSFTVAAGTTTAVVGSTGAGKTTLVSLVPRLIDATSGAVLVNGVDVRDADPVSLGRRIGYVPQRAFLFSGTVASNLRHGAPDATDADLWDALEAAQATGFVQAMEGGLQAPISQGGTNVSGGQRQRLCIARALVRRPDVYVFDDASSALDTRTDAALRAALPAWTAQAAVLLVAQRISSVRHADQILVLEGGVVVGSGTHEQLVAGCPTYQEIVASQDTSGQDTSGQDTSGQDTGGQGTGASVPAGVQDRR